MDKKALSIQNELVRFFPDAQVKYQFANHLHKYRIERIEASCWLYLPKEFLDDHTEAELVKSLARWKVPEILHSSTKSRWLLLNENGVREVDENFAHPRLKVSSDR